MWITAQTIWLWETLMRNVRVFIKTDFDKYGEIVEISSKVLEEL